MRSRFLILCVPMLAACVAGTSLSEAATPRPVRASSIVVVSKAKRAAVVPLGLDVIAKRLAAASGSGPLVISCDWVDQTDPSGNGLPSSIDGHRMDWNADGEVWPAPDGTIPNVIHLWASECWALEIAGREHEPTSLLAGYLLFRGKRSDGTSGPALEVALHEAFHIALQSSDEGVVECAAARNAWPLVRQFAPTPFDAQLLLTGMAWRHAQSTGVYRKVC